AHHVPVVLVVQLVGGLDVLRHRVVAAGAAIAGGGAALLLQRRGELGVHVGGVGRKAVGEGGAVGDADGVRAGERDHVVGVKPLGGEHLLEPVDAGERRRKVGERLAGEGDAPVVAPRRHVEVDLVAGEEVRGVAPGEGDDVGAGDDAGALPLERRLGRVDHLEAAQAQVRDAGLLRRRGARRRRVEEDGGVAALDEAVVEEEADEPGADAAVAAAAADGVLDGVPHDLLRAVARALVVPDRETSGDRARTEHVAAEHVPVVLVVQLVGGFEVLHHRGVAGAVARPRQVGLERGVHVGGGGGEAVGEGGAVGDADGVRAGEGDHVVGVEPLVGEVLLELVEPGERRRQVGEGLVGEGDAPVVAAGRHGEVDVGVAEEVGGVAAGEGDDVGAGDDAGARALERRLRRVDHLEA
ncbi:hypothetical protein EE612_040916, partial [Oryza sativa]